MSAAGVCRTCDVMPVTSYPLRRHTGAIDDVMPAALSICQHVATVELCDVSGHVLNRLNSDVKELRK